MVVWTALQVTLSLLTVSISGKLLANHIERFLISLPGSCSDSYKLFINDNAEILMLSTSLKVLKSFSRIYLYLSIHHISIIYQSVWLKLSAERGPRRGWKSQNSHVKLGWRSRLCVRVGRLNLADRIGFNLRLLFSPLRWLSLPNYDWRRARNRFQVKFSRFPADLLTQKHCRTCAEKEKWLYTVWRF